MTRSPPAPQGLRSWSIPRDGDRRRRWRQGSAEPPAVEATGRRLERETGREVARRKDRWRPAAAGHRWLHRARRFRPAPPCPACGNRAHAPTGAGPWNGAVAASASHGRSPRGRCPAFPPAPPLLARSPPPWPRPGCERPRPSAHRTPPRRSECRRVSACGAARGAGRRRSLVRPSCSGTRPPRRGEEDGSIAIAEEAIQGWLLVAGDLQAEPRTSARARRGTRGRQRHGWSFLRAVHLTEQEQSVLPRTRRQRTRWAARRLLLAGARRPEQQDRGRTGGAAPRRASHVLACARSPAPPPASPRAQLRSASFVRDDLNRMHVLPTSPRLSSGVPMSPVARCIAATIALSSVSACKPETKAAPNATPPTAVAASSDGGTGPPC